VQPPLEIDGNLGSEPRLWPCLWAAKGGKVDVCVCALARQKVADNTILNK
jgi:hypothetical protein